MFPDGVLMSVVSSIVKVDMAVSVTGGKVEAEVMERDRLDPAFM